MGDKEAFSEFLEKINQLNNTQFSVEQLDKINVSYRKDHIFKLTINSSAIDTLPQNLPYFPELRQLRISKTRIKEVPSHFLQDYDEIHSLFLNHNEITHFQEGCFDNLEFHQLYINNNPFSVLDASLFSSCQTAYLSLSESLLQNLEETIFDNLQSMISLQFDNTAIEELPPTIFMNQKSLKGLSLTNTKLKTLDSNIFLNTQVLENLFLENNPQLKYLPDDIFIHTPHLKTLTLPQKVDIPLSIALTNVRRINYRPDYNFDQYKVQWDIQQSPHKLIKILKQIEVDIPVSLERLAELIDADKEVTEVVIRKLIKSQSELGRYLPLEQVFVKKSNPRRDDLNQILLSTTEKSRDALQTCEHCGDYQSVMIRTCTNCESNLPICNICKRGFTANDISVTCYHCEHRYHRAHLIAYIQSKGECPVCRKHLVQSKYD